ncbi:hypothetical protein GCM10023184_07940 [Flaviaesturariibacter amylovorans]|uniref:Uncharacterized protein n=2 Tax=Flaviaesturariibacter amylovorans TaxID=1084520 RepID=A0ABP8GCU0_9BACT
MCSVKLVPESAMEKNLVAQAGPEDGYLFYYQQALSKFVHPEAVFTGIVNADHFPGHVLISYTLPE